MVTFYQRDAVPVTESIRLEVVFADSAGIVKDTDTTPTIELIDAASVATLVPTSTGVVRTGTGHYRYEYLVPDGYTEGIWNDVWRATMDGYDLIDVFNFTVNSVGSIAQAGASVPDTTYSLDDAEIEYEYTQDEIKGILLLRGLLKKRLRSAVFKPDGSSCPIFSDDLLNTFLCAALSELNATPSFTTYTFADNVIQTLAADLMTQGAMLVAWSSQAIIEAGFELTVSDDGVTVNPPPVHSAIMTMYSTGLADYRSKLKEFKRNHRPNSLGLSAGAFLRGRNPRIMADRHRRFGRIFY